MMTGERRRQEERQEAVAKRVNRAARPARGLLAAGILLGVLAALAAAGPAATGAGRAQAAPVVTATAAPAPGAGAQSTGAAPATHTTKTAGGPHAYVRLTANPSGPDLRADVATPDSDGVQRILVVNAGRRPALPFRLSVRSGDWQSFLDQAGLTSGASRIVPLPGLPCGKRVDISLDTDGTVTETSEINNRLTFTPVCSLP